ncbi:MAG: MFS transporter [Candidatus Omnitrophota bacterium]
MQKHVEDKKKKSLKISVIEGAFASAMTGFTQDYFVPFLLLLGAPAQYVGILNAAPNLAGALVQLNSTPLVQRFNSRKKMINILVLLQAVMLIPMGVMAILHLKQPIVFIGLVVLFTCFGALANPAWGSLMSDLVDQQNRGHFFGWRQRILGFITVGAAFTAGLLLFFMKTLDIYAGFALLFSAAFIWRFISWVYLRKMYEPPLSHAKEHQFTLLQFLSRFRESNFAKFVFFVALMNFSVNLAAPFFAVMMLKELQFNYFLYTIITLSATLTIYLVIARWGRHADKVGNLKVIKVTAPFIGIIPLLWIINRSPFFLIGAQVFSGFLWAGLNLCTANFIYDAVTPEKRTRCIAYFNLFNGLALCLGSLIGGFSLSVLPPLYGSKILTLFMISAVLRLAVGIFLPGRLKEVRPVEKVKSDELFFSMIGIRPMLGIERKTIRF